MGDPVFWLLAGGVPIFLGWQSYKHADGEFLGYAATAVFLLSAALDSTIYLGHVVYWPRGDGFEDLLQFITMLAPIALVLAIFLALVKELGCLGTAFIFAALFGVILITGYALLA